MWFNCKQFSGNKLTFVTNIDAFKIAKYALSKSQIQVKRSHWIKPRLKLTVKMNQTFFLFSFTDTVFYNLRLQTCCLTIKLFCHCVHYTS